MQLTEYATYLTNRRRSAGTVRLRLFYIRKFAERIAPRSILDATVDDLFDYLNSNPAWSESTQQSIISGFHSYYSWAFKKQLVTIDPSEEILNLRSVKRTSRIATDPAIERGLASATLEEQAMLLLGSECGLRVSEIAYLHLTSRDGEWLTITGKGGAVRTVWLSPELVEILDEIEDTTMRHRHYFPGRSGRPIHPSTVWRHIRDVLGSNPHSLRHRAGTVVYRRTGNDLRVAQEFLGHKSPMTTAIYVHVERDDLRRAGMVARMNQNELAQAA